jgi:hypothetical protein
MYQLNYSLASSIHFQSYRLKTKYWLINYLSLLIRIKAQVHNIEQFSSCKKTSFMHTKHYFERCFSSQSHQFRI